MWLPTWDVVVDEDEDLPSPVTEIVDLGSEMLPDPAKDDVAN